MISKNIGYIANSLNIKTFSLMKIHFFLLLTQSPWADREVSEISFLKPFSLMRQNKPNNSWKVAPLKLFVLAFAVGFLIFGIYQTAIHGFNHAYWIFFYSLILFVVYGFIRNRKKSDTNGK